MGRLTAPNVELQEQTTSHSMPDSKGRETLDPQKGRGIVTAQRTQGGQDHGKRKIGSCDQLQEEYPPPRLWCGAIVAWTE